MHASDWMQILIFVAVLVALTPPLGSFIAKVLQGERHILSPLLGWLERLSYRVAGVDPNEEMNWKRYASALVCFNLMGMLLLFLMQMIQSKLPLNPQGMPNLTWDLAFNTAASFMTNTNWQSYSGETMISYFVQLFGLTVQNFVSAATGIAVMAALIRGIKRRQTNDLGNFWADLVRSTIHIFLPLSFVMGTFLVGQGVVQNLRPYDKAKTVEGADQLIPQGPAASQIAIKQLGSNGGGFFNANSAHPFENPTPLSNFIEMLAILLIPSALVWTYGLMVGSRREGLSLWFSMFFLWCLGLGLCLYGEYQKNPVFNVAAMMEGKEQRFGVTNSVLWAENTTVTSNGSVNCMHDSLSPLAGMVCMLNILLGEVIFGGVGCGIYGILIFVILAVFIAGLMVGRTPEYLGKKIDGKDVTWVVVAILLPNAAIKVGTAIACLVPAALAALNNAGPHGFSEMLYAFAEAGGNNGSAFAGLNANIPFYNVALGIVILIGRFGVIYPVLAIAGNLATKKYSPPSPGTFATDSPLFAALLVSVILIMGVLSFMPALSLGPIVEHYLMLAGHTF